jgi:hypothetical protein
MPVIPRRCLVLVLALPFLAAGCGKADDRLAVSGTVTWKGQLLKTGTVRFIPADAGLTTEATAVISNGAFSVPKEDGLRAGKYKVVVSSPDPQTQAGPPDAPPGERGGYPAKDRIPEDYSTAGKTKLTAEVSAGKDNRFEFTVP